MMGAASYYRRLFRLRGFRRRPAATLLRGVDYTVSKALGLVRVIWLRFGPARFGIRLRSAGRHSGAAGIHLQRECYEALLEHGWQLLPEGGVALDGGANQGVYACGFAARVGPSGRVLAFEPEPGARAALEANIALNGFRNVAVSDAALTDAAGDVALDVSGGSVRASIAKDLGHERTLSVPATTIDAEVARAGLDRLDLVKLDIEGAEAQALRGAAQTLERFRPVLAVEIVGRDDYAEIAGLLEGVGYVPFRFADDGGLTAMTPADLPEPNVIFRSDTSWDTGDRPAGDILARPA